MKKMEDFKWIRFFHFSNF